MKRHVCAHCMISTWSLLVGNVMSARAAMIPGPAIVLHVGNLPGSYGNSPKTLRRYLVSDCLALRYFFIIFHLAGHSLVALKREGLNMDEIGCLSGTFNGRDGLLLVV